MAQTYNVTTSIQNLEQVQEERGSEKGDNMKAKMALVGKGGENKRKNGDAKHKIQVARKKGRKRETEKCKEKQMRRKK